MVLACWSAPWAAGFWLIGNFQCGRRPPLRRSAGGLHSEPKQAWAERVDCAQDRKFRKEASNEFSSTEGQLSSLAIEPRELS